MAFATSYVNGQFLEDALNNSVAFDLVQAGTTTFRVNLFIDTITGQDKNASETLGTGPYATTYEVDTSGDYTEGTGAFLTGTTLSSSAGKLVFDESDATMAFTGVTWTGAAAPHGCAVSDDANADRIIAAINFGADYPVNSGTFTITWDGTNGIWYATY